MVYLRSFMNHVNMRPMSSYLLLNIKFDIFVTNIQPRSHGNKFLIFLLTTSGEPFFYLSRVNGIAVILQRVETIIYNFMT